MVIDGKEFVDLELLVDLASAQHVVDLLPALPEELDAHPALLGTQSLVDAVGREEEALESFDEVARLCHASKFADVKQFFAGAHSAVVPKSRE